MSDLISRQAAIDALNDFANKETTSTEKAVGIDYCKEILQALPSAQPEVKAISYQDCQNALLKMWMDNVVTDGEYRRIVDKLNAIQEEQDGIHQQKESD